MVALFLSCSITIEWLKKGNLQKDTLNAVYPFRTQPHKLRARKLGNMSTNQIAATKAIKEVALCRTI